MAIRLVKKKITQTNSNIKLEFLKYPSNTTSFIARLVSNLSPQHSHVHRHKLTHAAWPLYWLSLKIKTLPSPQTCLSPLPSFRQEAEKEGGRNSDPGCNRLQQWQHSSEHKNICHTCLPVPGHQDLSLQIYPQCIPDL